MTLNAINELISLHNTSTVDSFNKLRQGILERTDGLKIEALSLSDSYGTRLLEFCQHTLSLNVYATIILLTLQAENMTSATLPHLCDITFQALQHIPNNQIAASKAECMSFYIDIIVLTR